MAVQFNSTEINTLSSNAAFEMLLGKAGTQLKFTGLATTLAAITNGTDFRTALTLGATISQDTSQIALGNVAALDFSDLDLSTSDGQTTALGRIVTFCNSLLANYQLLLTYMQNFNQLNAYPTT